MGGLRETQRALRAVLPEDDFLGSGGYLGPSVLHAGARDQALRYAELLRSKGQEALRRQLEGRDVGTFSVTGMAGQTVNFAFAQETPEGRRVIAVWERWLQPFELRYGA